MLGMGITEKTPPSARRQLMCVSLRATQRTIFFRFDQLHHFFRQIICANRAFAHLTLTESEARMNYGLSDVFPRALQ
jgi:hypothetical protein